MQLMQHLLFVNKYITLHILISIGNCEPIQRLISLLYYLDNKKETGNDGEEGICGANKDSVVQTDDYTDSDDSCDPLPPDGSYKMMALSPKSSSVKVLEGTNVNDLLESLQDSSGTAPQEVCSVHPVGLYGAGLSVQNKTSLTGRAK